MRTQTITCTIDGCNKPHLARGYCGAHWAQWKRKGDPSVPDPRIIHGAARNGHTTREYQTWRNLIGRCTNPSNNRWKDYGGRGITVCERWRHSFVNFLADMGPRPEGKSIDRIDVNGNYEPDNCRWATRSEQQLNRRRPQLGTSSS